MAAYTSTQAGDWSSTATWGGSGPPGAGDTATVNHAVAITADTTIGGGTATTVLSVATTASSLAITGAKLTIRGNATFGAYNGGGVRIYLDVANNGATGAGVELDGNSGVAPTVSWDFDSMLRIKGTSSAHCYFHTKSGTAGSPGVIGLVGGSDRMLFLDATRTDFARLGDASTPGMTAGPSFAVTLPAGYSAGPFLMDHCTVDSCGQFPSVAMDSAAPGAPYSGSINSQFTDSAWTNAVGQFCCVINSDATPITTGTRLMQHCVFDATSKPYLISPRDFTIQHNAFLDNFQSSGHTNLWASFTDNFVYKSATEESAPLGSVSATYVLTAPSPETGSINDWLIPHNGNTTFSGNRYEYIGSRTDGIWIGMSEGNTDTSNRTVTLVNNVATGGQSLTNGFHNPNDLGSPTCTAEHNTVVGIGSNGAVFQSTNASPGSPAATAAEVANQMASLRANIFHAPTAGSGLYACRNIGTGTGTTGIVVDALAAANAGYNGIRNLSGTPNGQWTDTTGTTPISGATACTNGTPYDSPMSGATPPGQHDVVGDPGFVDSSRGVAAFDAHVGGPGTVANALLKLAAQYDSTNPNYVAGYTTAALLAWTMAGFVPTNAALRGASYAGDAIGSDAVGTAYAGTPDIGAMAVQATITFTPWIFCDQIESNEGG